MSDRHHHDEEHVREHERPLSGPALRAKALESLLVEKGLVDPKALDELIDTYETKVGPRNGARIVARDDSGAVARADLRLVGVDQLVERLGIDEALLDEQGLERLGAQRGA